MHCDRDSAATGTLTVGQSVGSTIYAGSVTELDGTIDGISFSDSIGLLVVGNDKFMPFGGSDILVYAGDPGRFALDFVPTGSVGPVSSVFFDLATVSQLIETVTIDIKSGNTPNSINPGSKQKIPIAVFTTETFDATQIDPLTVVPDPVFPLELFALCSSDSSWTTELLPGTSLQIDATTTELSFDLTTPLETNAAVVLMSNDPDFRQFQFGQGNQPGFVGSFMLIQGIDFASEFSQLPFDDALTFPAGVP